MIRGSQTELVEETACEASLRNAQDRERKRKNTPVRGNSKAKAQRQKDTGIHGEEHPYQLVTEVQDAPKLSYLGIKHEMKAFTTSCGQKGTGKQPGVIQCTI